MPYLHTALANTNAELQQACLFPSYQQLSLFAERHQNLDLSDALELFADRYTSFMRQRHFQSFAGNCSIQCNSKLLQDLERTSTYSRHVIAAGRPAYG